MPLRARPLAEALVAKRRAVDLGLPAAADTFPAVRIPLQTRGDCNGGEGSAPRGLANVGNTCYANAVVQCIFHTRALRAAVPPGDVAPHRGVTRELSRLMAALDVDQSRAGCDPRGAADASVLAARLGFDAGVQHDAHEFLRALMASLDREQAQAPGALCGIQPGPLVGAMRHRVRCLECDAVTEHVDEGWCAELAVAAAALRDGVAASFAPARLRGPDKYECPSCRGRTEAVRWSRLQRLPRALVLVVHRGVAAPLSAAAPSATKDDAHVVPELYLDLTPYTAGEALQGATYRLAAYVDHRGLSAGCGHYLAIARLARPGLGDEACRAWARINDAEVTPISEAEAVCGTHADLPSPYILVYELQGGALPRAPPACDPSLCDH